MAKVGKTINGTTVGTPLNMAPECIQGNCSDISKSDLWSLGVIFYQLLFGEVPFFGMSLNELYQLIQKKSGSNLKLPSKPAISPKTKELLQRLLEKDVQQRIGWKEIFQHEYFKIRSERSPLDNSQKPTSINNSSDNSQDYSNSKSYYINDLLQNYSPRKVEQSESSFYKKNV